MHFATLKARTLLSATLITLALSACGGQTATLGSTASSTTASATPVTEAAKPTAVQRAATATAQPTVAATETPQAEATETSQTEATEAPTSIALSASTASAFNVITVDSCSLLDANAVAALYGKLLSEPTAMTTETHQGNACLYEAEKVSLKVQVYAGNDAPAAVLVSELQHDGFSMKQERGSDDQRFFGVASDRAALLMVKDNAVVVLSLINKTDNIKHAATLLKGMGAMALTHLNEQVASVSDTTVPALEETTSEPATGDAQSACALLTVDEVEQVLGKLDSPPDNSMRDDNGAPACAYSATSGLLIINASHGDDAAMQKLMQQAEHHGAKLQAVSGLGDVAYGAAAKLEGAPNKDALQSILIVRKGGSLLMLGMLSNHNAADAMATLQHLAPAAIARVS